MTCKTCKHFHYEYADERKYTGMEWEDFWCKNHHTVTRDGDDFVPADECHDYVYSYIPTREEAMADKADEERGE